MTAFLLGIIVATVVYVRLLAVRSIAGKLVRTLNAWHAMATPKTPAAETPGAEIVADLKKMGLSADKAKTLAALAVERLGAEADRDTVFMEALRLNGRDMKGVIRS